jgi:hypothetical protein
MSFNTVEGYKVGLSGFYRKEKVTKMADSVTNHVRSWNFKPEVRYGFASKQTYGTLDVRHSITQGSKAYTIGLTGGSFIFQFNGEEPINEQVNAIYSLWFRQNYMKLYEQDFAKIYYAHRVNDGFTYRSNFTVADRRELFNNSDFSFYKKPERVYDDNRPDNLEASPDAFRNHRAMIWQTSFEWRPGLKYSIRNGRKNALYGTAPLINFSYTKGLKSTSNEKAATDFDLLEAGIEHYFNFGVSGKLDFNLRGGAFLNNRQVFFQDYKHFGGNRTIFANMGVASNYRFLDYYQYSTQSQYVSSIVHYQFRKFLLTQLPMLRFSGVRENIFFNYLKTQNSPHYWEIGYSLDNLFRIFRVEMGAGFENERYSRGGVRFGIASFINIGFDEF